MPHLPRVAVAAGLLLVVVMASAGRVDASSLFELLGPRAIAVGEAARADAKGAEAISLNPAGLALNKELAFETSYGRRGEDGADVLVVSACDSTVPVPGCFYYRYLNADPTIGGTSFRRRAHEVGYAAARAIGPSLVFGFTYKYFDYNSELTGDHQGDASGHSIDLGLEFIGSENLKLGIAGYNLAKSADSSNYPRAFGGGILLRPVPSLSITADAVFDTEVDEGQSSGRYGGGVEYFWLSSNKQTALPLRVGVVHSSVVNATYMTGGLGYRTPKIGVDVGMRKQVAGDGDELMIVGSIRVFGPAH